MLLGLEDSTPPPPRRRLRPSRPGATRTERSPERRPTPASDAGETSGPASLEDLIRRVFEPETETAPETESPPAEDVPSRPAPPHPSRPPDWPRLSETGRLRADGRNVPPRTVPEVIAANPVKTPPMPLEAALSERVPLRPPEEAEAVASKSASAPLSGVKTLPSALALRLRRNPAAARDAFIYAEIFGRPLADRPGNAP